MQPCGHCGVCKKCAGDILVCPTCSGIVEGCRDSKLKPLLRPLALGDAFNSAIQPDIEMPSKKCKSNRKRINPSMEIFGGRERELDSRSEDSSEDEETFLNTPATTVIFNRSKQLCASGHTVERIEGCSSEGGLGDEEDRAIEDDGNNELHLQKTSTEHQMGSTVGVNSLDTKCTTTDSLLHDESNKEDSPILEQERYTSHTSIGAESEGGTKSGNKRRSSAERESQPKRHMMNHSKPTHAKEVLRLLADQQSQPESSASVRVRRGRERS